MKNALAALIIAIVGNYAWTLYGAHMRAIAPSTDWFYVQSINVADGSAGNPNIPVIYDRVIKKPFVGEWYAELKRASDQFLMCSGNGKSLYDTNDTLPETGVTLKWFMNRECVLPPGQYFIETSYKIKADGYPEKNYRVASNLFTLK